MAIECQTSYQEGNRVRLARPPALLTQRAGDEVVGSAILRLSWSAGNQYFRRTSFRGIGIEALALLEALGQAELVGAGLAVRGAVGGNWAYHPSRHHRGRLCQS